ncbi:MAG: protein-L-isoaspartate(D-aspartate) O-methyltransferase [Deltaproteobacteria bacterium]|nr:protein-L-isoaspartate(D-aspartate) O-methyltransferase [Deltaproteobacteria bacterium]
MQDNPYQYMRDKMVSTQIKARGIRNREVLDAMIKVQRHLFVPDHYRKSAYSDYPLPIGHGQTISQPYIVAYMTEILNLESDHRVLEIGTGSGYQAAILAELIKEVYTVEIIPELEKAAKNRLMELGYDNVKTRSSDGYLGWKEYAPYDAIVVTAAAGYIPPPLIDQLKDKGRMIIPVGSPFNVQTLMLVEKKGEDISTRSLMSVRFVPFRRGE